MCSCSLCLTLHDYDMFHIFHVSVYIIYVHVGVKDLHVVLVWRYIQHKIYLCYKQVYVLQLIHHSMIHTNSPTDNNVHDWSISWGGGVERGYLDIWFLGGVISVFGSDIWYLIFRGCDIWYMIFFGGLISDIWFLYDLIAFHSPL